MRDDIHCRAGLTPSSFLFSRGGGVWQKALIQEMRGFLGTGGLKKKEREELSECSSVPHDWTRLERASADVIRQGMRFQQNLVDPEMQSRVPVERSLLGTVPMAVMSRLRQGNKAVQARPRA